MNKPKIILLYNPPRNSGTTFPQEQSVPGYSFTADRKRFGEADVVLFGLHELTLSSVIGLQARLPGLRKRKGQLWVSRTMECDKNWFRQRYKPFMRRFDLTMSYRQDADVHMAYIYPGYEQKLRNPPEKKQPDHLINAFISSRYNHSGRVEYLKELMKHLDVHSYGRLFKNRYEEESKGRGDKRGISSGYKFSIAFENAIGRDYVTEKFYQPLISGSVPVYLGAPNIEDYAPGDHCFINTASWDSPRTLAEYLLHLDHDDGLYGHYHGWKNRPFRKEFIRLLQTQRITGLIRLCTKLDEVFGTTPP